MSKIPNVSALFLVALALAPAAALAGDEPTIKAIDVPGSDTPKFVVKAVVDSPPEKVWAVVSDCSHYKERLPRIAASRLVSKSGNTRTCEVTIEMPFPLSNLTAVTKAVHEESGGKYARRWTLVKGDYKVNEGSWEIAPADAARTKSLVTYTVHAEPTTSVPAWVREKAQKKALPELIERLREEAKKIP